MTVNAVRFLGTGSDDTAIALKKYMGHFAEAWRPMSKLFNSPLPVIHRSTEPNGKEFQFLQFADIPDAEEFTPGDEMTGQNYAIAEGSITADKYLVAHKFVPRDHMKKAHFNGILERLASAHARQIAMGYGRRIFTLAALAARASASTKNGLTVHSGGNRVTRSGTSAVATAYPTSSTGAANFRADLRTLARQMDEDNIPPEMRCLWITPYMNEVLLYDNTNQVFSKDFIPDGLNSQQKREVRLLEGFKLIDTVNTVSNNGEMPSTNVTTGPSKYQGNFTIQASTGTPVALALTGGPSGEAAVGVVTFETIQHVVKYYEEKMSWMVASFTLAGAGQQDVWCAGSVEVIV